MDQSYSMFPWRIVGVKYKFKILAKCSSFYPISAQQTLSTGKLSFNDTAFVPFNGNSDSTLWKIFSQMRTDSNEQTLYLFLVMFVMKGFLSFPIKTAEDKDKKIGKLCNPKLYCGMKAGKFKM